MDNRGKLRYEHSVMDRTPVICIVFYFLIRRYTIPSDQDSFNVGAVLSIRGVGDCE